MWLNRESVLGLSRVGKMAARWVLAVSSSCMMQSTSLPSGVCPFSFLLHFSGCWADGAEYPRAWLGSVLICLSWRNITQPSNSQAGREDGNPVVSPVISQMRNRVAPRWCSSYWPRHDSNPDIQTISSTHFFFFCLYYIPFHREDGQELPHFTFPVSYPLHWPSLNFLFYLGHSE